jgi:CSLREA domain-containing protein
MKNSSFAAIAFSLLIIFLSAGAISAATCTVTTADDHVDQTCNGDCSLREAILEPSCSTIDFSLDVAGYPIVLTLGELVIGRPITIKGWGADAITISGNDTSRIFYVSTVGTLNLSGVTLRDGNGMGTLPANGGAILSYGPANLDGVYVRSNQAPGQGAAISYEGSAGKSIRNSTIAFNLSSLTDPANAAIANGSSSGPVQIFNSSLYGNTGTAIWVFGNAALLINSTVAFNGSKGIYAHGNGMVLFSNSIAMRLYRSNTFAGIATYGYNFVNLAAGSASVNFLASDHVNIDPTLAGPQFNGGHVPTMALLPGSPAIDAGSNERAEEFFLTTDQRGFDRFVGGVSGHPITDIGAYEFNSPAPPPVTVAGRVLGGFSGNPLRSQTVKITDMLGNTRSTLSSSLGWFVFDDLPAGFVYRVTVNARRGPQQKTVFADQNLSDVDIPIPGQ